MEHRSHRIRNRVNRTPDEPEASSDLESEMLAPLRVPAPLVVRPSVRSVREVSDRRRWAPAGRGQEPREPARDVLGRQARVKVKPKTAARASVPPERNTRSRWSYASRLIGTPSFGVPKIVKICIQRKIRREVLFAKSRTGKGYRTRKRYNEWSFVHCR